MHIMGTPLLSLEVHISRVSLHEKHAFLGQKPLPDWWAIANLGGCQQGGRKGRVWPLISVIL